MNSSVPTALNSVSFLFEMTITAKNYPILRRNISAFRHQLKFAVFRRDSVSIIHRTAAFLGSYFDMVFAVNSIPHPG
jgi:hypothetical protein